MFSRLNLKVRCERRRRNKSYTSTGLARKRLTRSPFAPWLLLLMILWKYPLPWCWLSPQPYKSTWAGSGWLEEAISNDWVARQSMANSGGASRVKLSQGMVIDSGRSKSSISLSRREKSMARNGNEQRWALQLQQSSVHFHFTVQGTYYSTPTINYFYSYWQWLGDGCAGMTITWRRW